MDKELSARLNSLSKNDDFRRFMAIVADFAHLNEVSMAKDRGMLEFLEGERSLGLKIFNLFPASFYAEIIIETEERLKNDNRKRNNDRDNSND